MSFELIKIWKVIVILNYCTIALSLAYMKYLNCYVCNFLKSTRLDQDYVNKFYNTYFFPH